MKLSVGTRTVLYGVHAFWFHGFTVWRAWVWLYGRQPAWWQLVAIMLHDAGYLGMPNLDGPEGRQHPFVGARWACRVVDFFMQFRPPLLRNIYWKTTEEFALGHSRELSKQRGKIPSLLCAADKACVLFDPPWLYLLRARLAGELTEFKQNAEPQIGKVADEVWLDWYRARVRSWLRGLDLRPEVLDDLDAGKR